MTQRKQAATVTRSLQQVRRCTPAVRRPPLDEATRTELARLVESARAYLVVDNLPAVWAVLAGHTPGE